MEDIIDVITLLIILIFTIVPGIISFIAKNRRKSSESQSPTIDNQVEAWDFGNENGAGELNQPAGSTYFNYDDLAVDKYLSPDKYRDRSTKVDLEESTSLNFLSGDEIEVDRNPLKNFNLRDAVIYSEILKPKF